MRTHAEIDAAIADLRAAAVGPRAHDMALAMEIAALVGEQLALGEPEPAAPEPTPEPTQASVLVDAEQRLADMGGPERNPHLAAAIASIKAEPAASNEPRISESDTELELDGPDRSAALARQWLSEQTATE